MHITHVTGAKDKFLNVISQFNEILLNLSEPFLVSTGTLPSRSKAVLLKQMKLITLCNCFHQMPPDGFSYNWFYH